MWTEHRQAEQTNGHPSKGFLRTSEGVVELIEKRLPLLAARRLALCYARGFIWYTGLLRLSCGEPPKRRDGTSGPGWPAGTDSLIPFRLGDRFVYIVAQFREEGLILDVSEHH